MPVVEFIQEHQLIHVKAKQLHQYEELLGKDLREITQTVAPDIAPSGHDSEHALETLVPPANAVPETNQGEYRGLRFIKVGEVSVVRRKNDSLQVSDPKLPNLILRGQWLARAGFCAGQKVQVQVKAKCLIIQIVEEA